MKSGSNLSAVAERIAHIARSARDFLARPAQVRMTHNSAEKAPSLVLDDGTGALSFGISDVVHNQLSEFTGIPIAYWNRLREDAPDLLAANANAWLQRGAGRRLVRTVLDEESRPLVRAFLSDRYRPLDNAQLLEAVLPQLSAQGTRIISCELTPTKLYLKAVSERITAEVRPGDVVMAGVVVTNSETGFGALAIQPLTYTLKCANGLIAEDATLRQHHVGRRHGDPGDIDIRDLISDEARTADDRAFFLKVRDITKAALDVDLFRRQVERLQQAAKSPITSNHLDRVVEVTAKRFGLSEDEGAGVLAHLVRGGDLSKWGLSSAVTRFSQDVDDYDRATDLERIGGRLIELPQDAWAALASVN